jgi:hypothetical protein
LGKIFAVHRADACPVDNEFHQAQTGAITRVRDHLVRFERDHTAVARHVNPRAWLAQRDLLPWRARIEQKQHDCGESHAKQHLLAIH